jgi:glutaredoxin 2
MRDQTTYLLVVYLKSLPRFKKSNLLFFAAGQTDERQFEQRVDETCLGAFLHCLKDTPRYLLKATTPCAVAYDYARIRRLVRLKGHR